MVADRIQNETLDDAMGRVLAEWIDAVDRGEAPEPEQFIARHPRFAGDLRKAIENWRRFDALRLEHSGATSPPDVAMSEDDVPNDSTEASSAVFSHPFAEGTEVGDYRLMQVIGAGGMAVVYRALQQSLDRDVAVKIMRSTSSASGDDLDRFRSEARTVARLDHRGIVSIYEVATHQQVLYFSMKLIDGCNLMQFLPALRDQPSRAAEIVMNVSRAVHHAHQRGVLHRDLKPSNILIDSQGQPHVTDFGLAKSIHIDGDLTQPGFLVGTPNYMAPEQTRTDAREISVATDVHGLGTILYTTLTGSPPYQSDSVLTTLAKIREREPVPPARINSTVKRDLDAICLKCLEKDPQRRYESAAALADDLQRYLDGHPVMARTSGPLLRSIRWAKRNRLTTSLVSIASVLLVALVINLVSGRRQVEQALAKANEAYAVKTQQAETLRKTLQLALSGMTRTLPRVSDAKRPGQYGPEQTKILKQMLGVFEGIADSEIESPELRADAAMAYERMASLEYLLGNTDRSIEASRRAHGIAAELSEADPQDFTYRILEVENLYDVGYLLLASGQSGEAERVMGEVLPLAEKLSAETRESVHADRATRCLIRGLLAVAKLGVAKRRPGLAEQQSARAVKLAEQLFDASPESFEAKRLTAEAHRVHGDHVLAVGNIVEAREHFEHAESVLAELNEHPDFRSELRPQLAHSYSSLAKILDQQGETAAAIELTSKAVGLVRDLVREDPNVVVYRHHLASTLDDLAWREFQAGELDDTELADLRNQSIDQYRLFARENPGDMAVRISWAHVMLRWARALRRCGQLDEAEACASESATLAGQVLDYESVDVRFTATQPNRLLGEVASWRGDLSVASEHFEAMRSRAVELQRRYGTLVDYVKIEADALLHLARTSRRRERDDEARRHLHDAQQRLRLLRSQSELLTDRQQLMEVMGMEQLAKTELGIQLIATEDADALIRLANDHADPNATWSDRLLAADLMAHWPLISDASDAAKTTSVRRAGDLVEQLHQQAGGNPMAELVIAWLLVAHSNPDFHDPRRSVRLAKRAVAKMPKFEMAGTTLGLAHYRDGDYAAAIERLMPIVDNIAVRSAGPGQRRGHALFVLAMCRAQQGEMESARELLQRGARWMDRLEPEYWELQRFRAEAQRLIRPPDPDDPTG